MPKLDEPRDEALRRLDERLDALATATRREPKQFDLEGAAGEGFRVVAELLGGVLAGLGLGWLLDRTAHTSPFGLIGGVLLGTGLSIYLVARSAVRMSGTGARSAPKAAAPFEDEDDDPAAPGHM